MRDFYYISNIYFFSILSRIFVIMDKLFLSTIKQGGYYGTILLHFKIFNSWSVPRTNRTDSDFFKRSPRFGTAFARTKNRGFSFELLVNSASLLAVLLIYRNDLIRLTKNGLSYIFTRAEDAKSDFFFIIYLVIATIPAGVIGVLFKDYIDQYLKGVKMVGISLLITAVGLWIIRNLRGRKMMAIFL